jgi:hypothetical protein
LESLLNLQVLLINGNQIREEESKLIEMDSQEVVNYCQKNVKSKKTESS